MSSDSRISPAWKAPVAAIVVVALLVCGVVVVALQLARPARTGGQAESLSSEEAIESVEAAIDSARHYLRQQEPAKAETILRAAADKYPSEQTVRFLLGETLLELEQFEEAYDEYSAGISIGPDHHEYRHAAGTIAAQLGLLEEAEAHYLIAQKLNPQDPRHPLYLAQVQRKLGKIAEARANLVVATKLDPTLSIGWASLAGLALDENRPTVALDYIARARELEPHRTDWRVIEARIYRRMQKPDEAIALLYALPSDARLSDNKVMEELATCLGMLGRDGEAAVLYVEAANADSDNSELLFAAAKWLDRSGQAERAAIYAERAERLGHVEAGKFRAALQAQVEPVQEP